MQILICGFEVLIDDEDYEKVINHNWHIDKNNLSYNSLFYFLESNNKNKSTLRLHRYIMGCIHKDGKTVDHINGNTLDNRKCNLRICINSDNIKNCKRYKSNTSGFKGVSWNKQCLKWKSYIQVNGKNIHLGLFRCARRAYEAYCEASKKYHGEYGRIK